MKVKELSFALGTTLNMGNFNSARVDHSETILLDETDDPDVEYDKLKGRVKDRIFKEVDEIMNESQKT